MAQFIPSGWQASPEANRAFSANYRHIRKLVEQKAKNFFAPPLTEDDFIQEGLTAAVYAIDTFDGARGSVDAYMRTVVQNALSMVVSEYLAQRRAAYSWKQEGHKWVRVRAEIVDETDTVPSDTARNGEQLLIAAENDVRDIRRRTREERRLIRLKANLSEPARLVLDLRLSPPLPLLVLARNMSGRKTSRVPHYAIAAYTGLTANVVEKATREIRNVATLLLLDKEED